MQSTRALQLYNECFGAAVETAEALAREAARKPDGPGRVSFVLNALALQDGLRGAYWVDRDVPVLPEAARRAVRRRTGLAFVLVDPCDGQDPELWMCRAADACATRRALRSAGPEELAGLSGLPVVAGQTQDGNARISVLLRGRPGDSRGPASPASGLGSGVEATLAVYACRDTLVQCAADERWRAGWAALAAKELGQAWSVMVHRRVVGFAA